MEVGKMQMQRNVGANEGPSCVPAIREEQGNIESSLKVLAEAIDVLHKRIEPVMRTPQPGPGVCENNKRIAACEIADWMHRVTAQIDGLRTRIEDMVSNLEL